MKIILIALLIGSTATNIANAQSWRSSNGVAVSHYTDHVRVDQAYEYERMKADLAEERYQRDMDAMERELERSQREYQRQVDDAALKLERMVDEYVAEHGN